MLDQHDVSPRQRKPEKEHRMGIKWPAEHDRRRASSKKRKNLMKNIPRIAGRVVETRKFITKTQILSIFIRERKHIIHGHIATGL